MNNDTSTIKTSSFRQLDLIVFFEEKASNIQCYFEGESCFMFSSDFSISIIVFKRNEPAASNFATKQGGGCILWTWNCQSWTELKRVHGLCGLATANKTASWPAFVL